MSRPASTPGGSSTTLERPLQRRLRSRRRLAVAARHFSDEKRDGEDERRERGEDGQCPLSPSHDRDQRGRASCKARDKGQSPSPRYEDSYEHEPDAGYGKRHSPPAEQRRRQDVDPCGVSMA